MINCAIENLEEETSPGCSSLLECRNQINKPAVRVFEVKISPKDEEFSDSKERMKSKLCQFMTLHSVETVSI